MFILVDGQHIGTFLWSYWKSLFVINLSIVGYCYLFIYFKYYSASHAVKSTLGAHCVIAVVGIIVR